MQLKREADYAHCDTHNKESIAWGRYDTVYMSVYATY